MPAAVAQEQTLTALRTTQESIISFLKPFAAITEPIFDTAWRPERIGVGLGDSGNLAYVQR